MVSRGGGGGGRQVMVPRGGGVISRQTVVPSTDAIKENIGVTHMFLGIQRNDEVLLNTGMTHFELLHMFSLHDKHGVCCSNSRGGGNGVRG